MARSATKTRLLDIGRCIFSEKGYNHAGIDSILKAADVPKGSFYNYFSSKEDFGLQVIDDIATYYDAEMSRFLDNDSLSNLDRLRGYFGSAIEYLESKNCRNGCLIGTLGQEMADQNEAFRSRLEEIFARWVARFADCLEAAREAGELSADVDPRTFAEFLLNAWQGAVLRAKTSRDTAPLRTFLSMTFDVIAVARR
jgi:TetR/AcrR family transcriptional repressor of nem operon